MKRERKTDGTGFIKLLIFEVLPSLEQTKSNGYTKVTYPLMCIVILFLNLVGRNNLQKSDRDTICIHYTPGTT